MNGKHDIDTVKHIKSLAAVTAVFILAACQNDRFTITGGAGASIGVAVSGVRNVGTKSGQAPERRIDSLVVDAWLGSENRYDGGAMNGRVYEASDATDYHFIKSGAAVRSSEGWSLT